MPPKQHEPSTKPGSNSDESAPLLNSNDSQQSTSSPPARQVFTLKDQLIGFPYWQMTVIMFVRFSEPVAFTSLFPYVYFMVKHLRPEGTEASIATYAGYLSGTFALCQALTGVHWGRYSDKYGRKPILLLGLSGTVISLFWFGSSTSFGMAMAARCFGGFLNGNIGVIRTAIGEIAPKRRHQALAMSTMSLLWQLGCVVGPVIGGSLADPIKNHPDWFPSAHGRWRVLFTKRPFLLPNMVTCSLLLMSTMLAFLFLEETHEDFRKRNMHDPGIYIGDKLIKFITNGHVDKRAERQAKLSLEQDSDSDSNTVIDVQNPNDSSSLANRVDSAVEEDLEYVSGQFTNTDSPGNNQTQRHRRRSLATNTATDYGSTLPPPTEPTDVSSPTPNKNANGTFFEALTGPVIGTILMYALLALHTIVFDELLPLMLETPVMNAPETGGPSKLPFHFVGGMGMSSAQVGHLLSITGFVGIFFVMFLFPYVDGKYGTYGPFTLVTKLFPIIQFSMPFILFLANPEDAKNPEGFTKPMWVLLFIMCIKTMLMSLAFPGVMLLIQRSISNRKHTGGINGLSQMFAASARAIGPIVWGLIMAKGQELQLAELPWWTLALFSMSSFLLVAYVSKYKHILASEKDFK